MFSKFFKNEEIPSDVKNIRQQLLLFIKDQLQQWEGGEGGNIRSIQLYLFPAEGERSQYAAAVFEGSEDQFREEVQRIADDYALDLPLEWNFELAFAPAPAEAVQAPGLQAAMLVDSRKRKIATQGLRKGYIIVQQGETEQARYQFDAASGKITIGRDKMVQAGDGFHRENKIAFLAQSSQEANRFVSRQHAHVEWSEEVGAFQLFADEGGIPPRNKVKVRTGGNEPVKLQSTHIGYTLQHGDQIILGDSALLEFGYEA
ncbi:hypothetical protein SAMN05444008_10269 [Cnuella takakiae]|uniref:FHA domain-containing protein n=1 Tax=Cnuella takakiae TaxID=1302690 RepID=A0A1M4UWG7_9BACT|nr:FHA domain-containing protein [Cnuella takakiae]OLY92765.1 hypothetical protein BUE76_13355 [Cnuella takakiae]SHE61028.1 hypothetical protein SAMN05444008_10269 [Cnuella takakiae]